MEKLSANEEEEENDMNEDLFGEEQINVIPIEKIEKEEKKPPPPPPAYAQKFESKAKLPILKEETYKSKKKEQPALKVTPPQYKATKETKFKPLKEMKQKAVSTQNQQVSQVQQKLVENLPLLDNGNYFYLKLD